MRILFTLSILLLFNSAFSQLDWVKHYIDTMQPSYGLSEAPKGIVKINDGFLIYGTVQKYVFPYLYDLSILKIDSEGKMIWKRVFGLDNGRSDIPLDITVSNNTYKIVGSSTIGGVDTFLKNIWLLTLDTNGNVINYKDIPLYTDCKTSLKINGGYLVGGKTFGSEDFSLTKFDDNGIFIFSKSYGGFGSEEIVKILDIGTSYVLCGYSNSMANGDKTDPTRGNNSNVDYWIVKVDTNGNVLWDKTVGSSGKDGLTSAVKINDSVFLLGGTSDGNNDYDKSEAIRGGINTGLNDYWIVKIDINGNVLSNKSFGTSSAEGLNNITEINGKYYLIGSSGGNKEFDKSENIKGSTDAWIICLDSSANKIWDMSLGDSGKQYFGFELTSMNNKLYILGRNSNNSMTELFLAKYEHGKEYKKITGSVFADYDNNCYRYNLTENNMKNKILYNRMDSTYTITDNNEFAFYTIKDSAIIDLINIDTIYKPNCDIKSIQVNLSNTSQVNNVNFPIIAKVRGHCLDITSFSNSILRAGRWSSYRLEYVNNGFDTAYNASIEIVIDTSIVDSIKSSTTYTFVSNKLTFQLGTLRGFEDRIITYQLKLKTSAILGTSVCHKALIKPYCQLYTHPKYDSTKITAKTKCISKDKIELEVKNESTFDQKEISDIYTYKDDSLANTATVKLKANESKTYTYYLDSNTVFSTKLVLNNGDPVQPIILLHDDICALSAAFKTKNSVMNFHREHDSKEYEEDCDIVRGSYDPNIKSVNPAGITSERYTNTGTELIYRIDFQNTGNDTAFKVVITDSLSEFLNIATFLPGTSSHPYQVEFDKRKVKFIFDPVALVDSTTNEPESHGYVTFKIKHNSNIKPKSKIENEASIYFDFNPPIITNKVLNTIYDVLLIATKSNSNINSSNTTPISVFPNPTTNMINIELTDPVSNLSIELVDINGKSIEKLSTKSQTHIQLNAEKLEQGIYIIRCYGADKFLTEQKIQIRR